MNEKSQVRFQRSIVYVISQMAQFIFVFNFLFKFSPPSGIFQSKKGHYHQSAIKASCLQDRPAESVVIILRCAGRVAKLPS